MKLIPVIISIILLASFVSADCISDICADPDLAVWQTPGCFSACQGGTLSDECKELLCAETTNQECISQYCSNPGTVESRLTSLERTNQKEHKNFNIIVNNLRTEVNNLKAENGQLKDDVNSVKRQLNEKLSPFRQNIALYIILAMVSSGLFVLGISNKKQLRKIIRPSILTSEQKTQIQNYIRSYSQSYSKEQIIQGLKQQGWEENQIKEAYT